MIYMVLWFGPGVLLGLYDAWKLKKQGRYNEGDLFRCILDGVQAAWLMGSILAVVYVVMNVAGLI